MTRDAARRTVIRSANEKSAPPKSEPVSSDHIHLALLEKRLRIFLEPFRSGAIFNQDGKVLMMSSHWPQDWGTLKNAFKISKNFFPVEDGDLVVTNDTYNGGIHPSVINLISGFHIGSQKFYVLVRIFLDIGFDFAADSNSEGLKIPPMPLAHRRSLHEPMLDAISANPYFGPKFKQTIQKSTDLLWTKIDQLILQYRFHQDLFEKGLVQKFLTGSQKILCDKISELGIGDEKIEVQLESGEVIRCQVQFDGEGFLINLAGTGSSSQYFLPEAATVGACIDGVRSLFRRDLTINESFLSKVVVNIPPQSFLCARAPSPITAGALGMAPLLSQIVSYLSFKTTRRKIQPLLPAWPVFLKFSHSTNHLNLQVNAGGSATTDSAGIDLIPGFGSEFTLRLPQNGPVQSETRFSTANQSIECCENIKLIRIKHSCLKKESGGKGLHRGGLGQTKEFEILHPVSLTYFQPPQLRPLKEISTLNRFVSGSLGLKKRGSEEEIQLSNPCGRLNLEPGDVLRVTSNGGLGNGRPESE